MPTVIGVIFAALGFYCMTRGEDWLLGFLLFSGLFQAASVINFGSAGIQPFYLAACLFLFARAVRNPFWRQDVQFRGKKLLLAFGCLGVLSAVAFPVVFSGIPVYSPKVGIDDGFFYRPPLQLSGGNAAQAVYLVVELLTVWAAASAMKTRNTRIFYDFCFWFLAALIFVQFIFLQLGLPFPYGVFQNNPGYAMANVSLGNSSERVIGTFTEASGAGLALAVFYAGYFYEFYSRAGSILKVMTAAITIGLVRSSSSIAAMLAATALIVVLCPLYRFPWAIRRSRFWKLMLISVVAALIALSPAIGGFAEYTTEKSETLSYLHRTAADLFSIQLAAQTHWIGVGLGSNRPSSLLASLLSNVGAAGLFLFLLIIVQMVRNARGNHTWLSWALFAAVFDMCLGGPDITQPMLWILMTLAAYYGSTERELTLSSGQPIGAKTGIQDGS
jgi:uncharacterized membrane protein YhdT